MYKIAILDQAMLAVLSCAAIHSGTTCGLNANISVGNS